MQWCYSSIKTPETVQQKCLYVKTQKPIKDMEYLISEEEDFSIFVMLAALSGF